jgi:hypothetical protein
MQTVTSASIPLFEAITRSLTGFDVHTQRDDRGLGLFAFDGWTFPCGDSWEVWGLGLHLVIDRLNGSKDGVVS